MKLIVIGLFVAVLAALGVGLVFLLRSDGSSAGLANALTVRVGLSVLLFVLLMVAWYAGLIEPHGILPTPPPPSPGP